MALSSITNARFILYILLVYILDIAAFGCDVKKYNSGFNTEQFAFQTTIDIKQELNIYQVVYTNGSNQGTTKLVANFFNGNIVGSISKSEDVTPTGAVTTGDFSFILSGVSVAKAGLYEFDKAGTIVGCITLYILGKPTAPQLNEGAVPQVGGNITFNCTSWSTTVPSDHGLAIKYTWFVNGQNIASGSRFTLFDNTLSISNIQKTDKDKQITCRAIEIVTGAIPSETSNAVWINVHYGPDDIIFVPANVGYTLESNKVLQTITCEADCNPDCQYTWKKDGTLHVSTSTLSLGVLTDTDAATYTCRASRSGHSMDKSLRVNVVYGPSSMSPDNRTVYSEDISSTLPTIICSAHCWECYYSWAGPKGVNLQTANLTLGPLEKAHHGTYTCTATNTRSSQTASTVVMVEIKFGPDIVTLNPAGSSHTVDEGGYLNNIDCHAECYPDCTYVWTKQGQNNPESTDKILRIGNNIRRGKAGLYTCTTTNPGRSGTSKATATVNIYVRYGPDTVTLDPPKHTYTENTQTHLNDITCTADCFPSCDIKWSTNTVPIETNVLALGLLDKTHAGNYTCIATNTRKSKSSSKTVSVNVRYGPDRLRLEPVVSNPLVLVEGQFQQNISCSAACYPGCTEHWMNMAASSQTGTKVLSLGYAKRYYTGQYKCTSTNDADEFNRTLDTTLSVTVQYPPDTTVLLLDGEFIIENDAITLTCTAKGEPQDYTFKQWEHWAPDNTTVMQTYSGTTSTNENILVLKKTTYMDSGFYFCRVSNGVNDLSTHVEAIGVDNVQVNVKRRPLLIEGDQEVDARAHDNISLTVNVYSNDHGKFDVTWYKLVNESNELVGSNNERHNSSIYNETITVPFYKHNVSQPGYLCKLEIRDIQIDDFTRFEAVIENSLGSAITSRFIRPKGPPDTPKKFSVLPKSQTSDSITLTWYPGFHGGADQTYHTEYQSVTSEWTEGAVVFGGKIMNRQFQAKINGLSPGSSYLFRIYSDNIFGRSLKTISKVQGNTTFIDEDDIPVQSSSTGATVVGAVAGVVVAVVIILVVVFLLRRYKQFPGTFCKNEHTSDDVKDDTHVHYANINVQFKPTGNTANAEQAVANIRDEPVPYESLNPERESATPYEQLNTEDQDGAQRSGDNVYDDLDSKKTNEHFYSSMQEATSKQNAGKPANLRTEHKLYYDNIGMQQKDANTKKSKEDVPKEVVYSNLKLSNP